jgi:hypothetical protein
MFDSAQPDGRAEATVTMMHDEWRQLLGILQDINMPYKITAPLIHKIAAQCVSAQARGD